MISYTVNKLERDKKLNTVKNNSFPREQSEKFSEKQKRIH